jgi:acylphosphatase
MIRKTVYYSGNVQGVGFRYTAQRIAAAHTVTGYVKNLPDGRVELVLEADEKEIDVVLADVADALADYIRNTRTDTSPASGSFRRFTIAY